MASCCDPAGYEEEFDVRFARRQAARYRNRGPDAVTRRMSDVVASLGVAGASVLEIGGGVGELHLELLDRGAARAVNLELSPCYEVEAQRLLQERGATGRVERRLVDIATAEPATVEPADVVVLNRVVCCYPDYEELLGAASEHARRFLVFSHPPGNVTARWLVATGNLYVRLRGGTFRAFAHPPQAMRGVAARHGMRPVATRGGHLWQISAATR